MTTYATILLALLTIPPQGLETARLPKLRIVGGENVTIENFPYQVSISVNDIHNCGGSIINEYFILTAAHCLGYETEDLTVRAGSTIRNEGGVVRNISDIYPHPDYNSSTYDCDIGLIKLTLPLNFSEKIASIALPIQNIQNNSVDNMTGNVTGWGRLYQNGPPSEVLQLVQLPTLEQEICELVYSKAKITDRMFCAGYYEGGKDACQGDSGGPFAVDGVLEGITSWGDGCGEENSPGVYARVSSFVEFIDSVISN